MMLAEPYFQQVQLRLLLQQLHVPLTQLGNLIRPLSRSLMMLEM